MISPHTQGKSGKLIEYIELFARERVVIQYLNCMLRLASGGYSVNGLAPDYGQDGHRSTMFGIVRQETV